jgi:hypothetical protein
MSHEIESTLYRILTGRLIFSYDVKEYCLIQPSNKIKYQSSILYNSIINDEKYNEWIREENLERYMIFLGVWDKEMSNYLNKSNKQIEDLKVALYTNRYNNNQSKRIRNQLASTRDRVNNIYIIQQTYKAQTLEGYAESVRNEFIISNTLYYKKRKVFKSITNSYTLFSSLLLEINQQTISPILYRQLARSDLWRSYWTISKGDIFEGPVSEWTDEQRSLAGFSSMYDSVFSHPEKPADSVISDDDVLDGWMISQSRTNDKNKQQEELLKSNPKLGKAQEVFVFTDNPQSASEIIDMNSGEAMAAIRERFSSLDKHKELKHSQLPDIHESLQK